MVIQSIRNGQSNSSVNQISPNIKVYWQKISYQLSKSLWLCSSSAFSAAIVLSGSPAWADPGFDSDSNEFGLNFKVTLSADGTQTSDRSPSNPPVEESAAELQPSAPSSELLFETQPLEPSSEPSSEPFSEPPSEPSLEVQPSEPSSTSTSPASASNRSWQFSVEPYFFAPLDVNADVTVSGRSASIDLGLDDILNFDRAFDAGLRLRAQNDRLGFLLDGFYLYAENSGNLGRTFSSGSIFQFVQQNSPGTSAEFAQRFEPQQIQRFVQIGQQIGLNTPVNVTADGTVSVRQITIDAAVSYRVVDTSLNRSAEGTNFYPRLAIAPIAGVRTNILRQTIEVDDIRINGRTIPDRALPPIDRSFRSTRTLVEPLIGAQIDLALSEQWALAFRGDVSGFNIGARQNFTWNVMFGTQYNLSRNVALQLAYRFNGFDFETGEGLRRTELNLRQNGVMLNTIFRF
ncbi:outer membrane protein [Leptolyngbya ohadii]|uniref:outer membrane protein n=1 Tax=Leptolyngbya ohadii TaxID=1962290 RepID=UPI00117A1A35|nr:hypothetical protein [Leptolyngbya ohadii]